VLVLGAGGMLGSAVLHLFSQSSGFQTFGSLRQSSSIYRIPNALHRFIIEGIEAEDDNCLMQLFSNIRPDVVINCIGLVKQVAASCDPLSMISINALLPHRLERLCKQFHARLVHMSTDCVFSGLRGGYREEDLTDATDLYGQSKHLGEVYGHHAITLRTSIIGHEVVKSPHSLIEWFLAQNVSISGYKHAIFSGLPAIEIARIIRDYVIPNPILYGVYHVAATPISKFDLLTLVAEIYGKSIDIHEDGRLVIDRSLDAKRFNLATGYISPCWRDLIKLMHENKYKD